MAESAECWQNMVSQVLHLGKSYSTPCEFGGDIGQSGKSIHTRINQTAQYKVLPTTSENLPVIT
jgi:hypothetical protein